MGRCNPLVLGCLLVAIACFAWFGCDDGPGFGTGLDDGNPQLGSCEANGEYPNGPHYWDLYATAPPTLFSGMPQSLDLQSIYCRQETIKSLVFVLGAPG